MTKLINFNLNPKISTSQIGDMSWNVAYNVDVCEKYSEFFKQFTEIKSNPYHQYTWCIDMQDIRKFKIMNLEKRLPDNYKELVKLLCNEDIICMNVVFSGTSGSCGSSGIDGSSGISEGYHGTSGTSGEDEEDSVCWSAPFVEPEPEPDPRFLKNPFLEILMDMEKTI